MNRNGLFFVPILVVFSFLCFVDHQSIAGAGESETMKLVSPAFDNGSMIPDKYTCDGADISPPLRWGHPPRGTVSFAMICDDPDAPVGTWVHWVYYDIPAAAGGLPENVPPQKAPANGGKQGVNDFRKIGYGGPCPPGNTHRYFFRLYALDAVLNLNPGLTKQQLLREIGNHILGKAQLMGKYKR